LNNCKYNYIYNKRKIMPRISDIHSIIVPAENPNMSAHTYTEIYGGSLVNIVINGVTVSQSTNVAVQGSVSGGNVTFR
jgi:hypothetical protein